MRDLSAVGALALFSIGILPHAASAKTAWETLPGRSLDVGVGHKGHVWSIGPNRQAWRLKGRKWTKFPGLKNLQNIDAAPDGSAMAVRSDGTLHYHSGKPGARWQQTGVRTMDVGIGGGWVWLTNTQKTNGGGCAAR